MPGNKQSKPSMQLHSHNIRFHKTEKDSISKAPFILSRVPEPTLPRITLSELTFHLFLYKIQPTVYMRLWTRLGKARQLEGKGEGGGGMRAHAKARMLTAILSLLPAILSNM